MLILVTSCIGKIIRFRLKDDQATIIRIGSLPESHICRPYKGVSRNHFTLTNHKNKWVLNDLGSTNGTRVNGRKVQESELKRGDLMHAGIVDLSLQDMAAE